MTEENNIEDQAIGGFRGFKKRYPLITKVVGGGIINGILIASTVLAAPYIADKLGWNNASDELEAQPTTIEDKITLLEEQNRQTVDENMLLIAEMDSTITAANAVDATIAELEGTESEPIELVSERIHNELCQGSEEVEHVKGSWCDKFDRDFGFVVGGRTER